MILFSSFGHAANSGEQKKAGEDGGEESGIMTGNDNNGGNADGCGCCQRNAEGDVHGRPA